ncbi:MAG: TonB-dependent receptor plug domain-containing protein [Gammaproteobacteria bacterium]|nr:TonB-dependent receptor plug domain-containing protein [Gammaproteobacteria bacterium]
MLGVQAPAHLHDQEPIEEVDVHRRNRGTPEDAASPVDVMSREDMNLTGNPSVLEMIRNWRGPLQGIDHGVDQFTSNGLEGISNVNLRGLGPGRTLVLMNGRRLVSSPYAVAEQGGCRRRGPDCRPPRPGTLVLEDSRRRLRLRPRWPGW